MKSLNRSRLLNSLWIRVSIFVIILVSAMLLLLACKDNTFLSSALPSTAEHVLNDQVKRRLGGNPSDGHAWMPTFSVKHETHAGLEVSTSGISILHALGNTARLSQERVMRRHLKYGGSISVLSGLLLIAGAVVAIRKKGMFEMYYPQWLGCCTWPCVAFTRQEYMVLTDADGGRRRKKSFYSPMPPLAGQAYLELQIKRRHLQKHFPEVFPELFKARGSVNKGDEPIAVTLTTKDNQKKPGTPSFLCGCCTPQQEEYETNFQESNNNVSNAQQLLRMKNVGRKDRAILEDRLNRMKCRRKVLLAVLFIAYVGLCFVPLMARSEVSCGHGFFYETHLPFVSSLFVSKIIELAIYYCDTSLDGELGFTHFMVFFSISFFGYTDGYRDAMALSIADACALSENPIYNHKLARTLYHTMRYSYFGGVVLLQWVVFGSLGLFCDSSSAVLAKLLHMDALAACITIPPGRMWVWYGLNIAITIFQNIPQGVQQFIFVRFVKQHLFLTIAITVSAVSSIFALIRAMRRIAEAMGMAEAAARQAKSHHTISYEWLSALEGHYKGNDVCQGTKRNRDWISVLALHNRGIVDDFYEISRTNLGRGSFGSVVKSEHLSSHEMRAIKQMDKGGIEIEHVVREVQIMKELDHPNIIRLIETFHDRNIVYMVMELCEGTDLFDAIIAAGGLKEGPAAIVIQQAAQSLNYIHGCQICHRDLKPENFLLKARGPISESTVLKLIDFGTSRGFEESQVLHTQQGTPHYMAPEVIKCDYNHLCDIWSLGVVMHASLSARVPFDGGNEPMIFKAILNGNVKFAEPIWNQVSKEAKSLIQTILVKQPKRCTAKDILENPWVKSKGLGKTPPDAEAVAGLLEQLDKFGSRSELEKLVLMSIAYELPENELISRRDIFKALDSDDNGVISARELREALGKDSDKDVNKTLQGVDVDGNNFIDYTEFLAATLDDGICKSPPALWRAFQLFDRHGNGLIHSNELRMVLRQDADSTISDLYKTLDKNQDGAIDFAEFLEAMGVSTELVEK
mmetsp:Transcript_120369/g.220428  ORF Transcript_120369/g.220428 Transcript_120369/m.220428 type:complete len:1026 (+) Transcript_120369:64-3141(+)